MVDIVIPEAVFENFLKSLHSKIAAEMQAFRARLDAHEAVYRAQLRAGLESKMRKAEEVERRVRAVENRLRASEEELERNLRAAEDQIARKRREAEDQIECKRRAAEDEIARLRQLERLRQTAAIERGEWPQ
jgi:hypothetical protein